MSDGIAEYFASHNQQCGYFVFGMLMIWPEWWAWNTVAHDIFGLPAIEQWFQAFAFSLLVGVFGKVRYVTLCKP